LYHDEEQKGIEQKLHHYVQRLLVPHIIQHVAKPHVLMRSQQNCLRPEERQYRREIPQNAQNMCGDLRNWRVARGMDVLHVHRTVQGR